MQVGDIFEMKLTVAESDTAEAFGSGGLVVLATPRVIALMENAAFKLIQEKLPEGKTSVGVKVDVEHLSPTPVGMDIRVTAEITTVSENGKMIDFKVEAYDEAGLIAQGTHRRAIIDAARFLERCRSKLNK